MKTRFIVILLSILVMPVISFAGLPVVDPLGVGTGTGEMAQTGMGTLENGKQVLTIQKTMAKIGSAKASISDFVNKTKENVLNSEAVKQLQDYKKRITDGAAKLKAMKAEADKYVNMGKDAIDKGKEYVDKGKEYVEKGKEYVEQGKEALNTVKELKEQGGIGDALKGAVGGIAGDAAGKMGIDVDKAKGLTDKALDTVSKDKTELATEGGVKELTAVDAQANVEENVAKTNFDAAQKAKLQKDAELKQKADMKPIEGKLSQLADGPKLSDAPMVATTRKVGGFATVDAKANIAGVKANDMVAKATADVKAKASLAGAEKKAAAVKAVEAVKAKAVEAKANDMVAKATAAKAVADVKAKATLAGAEKKVAAVKAVEAVKAKAVEAKANDMIAKATVAKAAADVKAKASLAGAEKKAAAVKAVEAVKAKAVEAKANDMVAKAAAAKAAADVKAKASLAGAEKKAAAVKAVEAVKAKAVEAKANDMVAKAAAAKAAADVKAKATEKTKRKKFNSSFGYGKLQTSQTLSFAFLDALGSIGGDDKTGETEKGVLIVPEPALLRCQQLSKEKLNYETAIKDKKMDKCLRDINTLAISMVTDKTPKKDIDDASKDMTNSYVEFLTATYFEALEIYNESLTFKNNKLSPVLTTSTSDIDSSWRVAKEMHLVLGDRINLLHKLWSRVLAMKMFSQYASEKFANKGK